MAEQEAVSIIDILKLLMETQRRQVEQEQQKENGYGERRASDSWS